MFSNVKTVIRQLSALPPKVAKRASREAILPVYKAFLNIVKSKAPKDTGNLRSALQTKMMKAKKGRVGVNIQFRTVKFPKFFYPAVVEFGRKKNRGILKTIGRRLGIVRDNVNWEKNLSKSYRSTLRDQIINRLRAIIKNENGVK